MGSVFVGGGVGWAMDTKIDTVPYRDYLDANKYLVLVEDLGGLGDQAIPILHRLSPENIKSYEI